MSRKLVILGVNGHGKVIADIALAMSCYDEIVFLCNFDKKTECMGFPIVGRMEDAKKFCSEAEFVVAIGDGEMRSKWMRELEEVGASFATLVHPAAVLGSRVEIGHGTVVMAGCVINAEAKIGKGCIINTGASVDHGSEIGDYAHVAVGARVCGQVRIGTHTWVGASATVINGVNVCGECMIGAGAVVVKNIKEKGVYIGVPARRKEDA
jgi:sugar O-acyltransferase (sialic acid O-acetyltransferase NeuD family)